MLAVKLLGLLDIFIALVFWVFGMFGLIHPGFIQVLGFFLLLKGVAFLIGGSIVSGLDALSGLIIVISTSFALPKILVIIVALFLLQKGIFSMTS